jgi:diacylglycerol kinase family enzyme
MAGAGWDARAIALVSWDLKKRFGAASYIVAGFQAMATPLPRITVRAGSQTAEGELVLVGNGAYYGGRYRLFPEANWRDGLLEVSIFPRISLLGLLRSGAGLLLDRLYTTGGVRHFRVASVSLEGPASVPFHVEGENVGYLPATFSLEPETLRVVVP